MSKPPNKPCLISNALDRAFGEKSKVEVPADMLEAAEQEVRKAQSESKAPVGMVEELTGKYILVFPSGRKQVCKSKSHAIDVARGYGVDKLSFAPFREIYDPTSPNKPFRGGDGLIMNTYEKSPYQNIPTPGASTSAWPTIGKLLENVFPDQRVREAFMNWFAVIFNTGKKTGTAWVVLGPQGSGKTALVEEILFPLLGLNNCIQLNQDALTTRYNELLDKKQLVCYNEVHSSMQAAERIKTWITEREMRLEDKSGRAHIESNHMNLIFTSNHKVPVEIEADDRRFSVVRTGGPLNALTWFKGARSIRAIRLELESFAAYLHGYTFSADGARRSTFTPEKQRLIEASMDPFDQLTDMLRRKQVTELRELAVEAALSSGQMSELSGFSDQLKKDIVLQLVNALSDEQISQTKVTQELKKRGFSERRGSSDTEGRKRVYVWGANQNPDKSDKKS